MSSLKVALGQIAPVWFDRETTLSKVSAYVAGATRQNCELVVFGEALDSMRDHSRPGMTRLLVNRKRQSCVEFED